VLNTAPDRWTITFPSEVLFSNFTFNSGWAEPESSLTNILDSPGSNQLFILSDIGSGGTPVADGSTVNRLGSVSGNVANFDFTFHDAGDGAAVPEGGSTFGLLLLAITGLFGANRLRSVRLA
jgi:hypothetical protein